MHPSVPLVEADNTITILLASGAGRNTVWTKIDRPVALYVMEHLIPFGLI